MSQPTWDESNRRFLSERIAKLRALLEARVRQVHVTPAAEPPLRKTDPPRSLWRARRPPQLPPQSSPGPDFARSGDARASTPSQAASEVSEEVPALSALSRGFGLSAFEEDVLVLCVATELDTGMGALFARAMDDPARPYPTFALAFSLFDHGSWEAVSPMRPLRRHRLIEIASAGGQPLTASALRIDERILNYVKGLNHLDERLEPIVTPFDPLDDASTVPLSQRVLVDRILARLRQTASQPGARVVQLLGRDPFSKRLVAQIAAAASGLNLLRLPVDLLPTSPGELEALARL
jgi:hypothetical protein